MKRSGHRHTSHTRARLAGLRKSAGIGLVTAIFLLVVLSGLAVAIVSVVTSQRTASVQDEQSARAYQAARAGIEWALLACLRGASLASPVAITCPSASQTAPSSYSFAMPAGTSLSSFAVTVNLSNLNGPIVIPGTYHYQIQATACNEPDGNGACPNAVKSPDYVQRVVQVQL